MKMAKKEAAKRAKAQVILFGYQKPLPSVDFSYVRQIPTIVLILNWFVTFS